MAVALGKNDNAAAARDRPALRGLQAIVLPALRFLDRPTHAFKNAPCQHDCLKARDISELFRGSLGVLISHWVSIESLLDTYLIPASRTISVHPLVSSEVLVLDKK